MIPDSGFKYENAVGTLFLPILRLFKNRIEPIWNNFRPIWKWFWAYLKIILCLFEYKIGPSKIVFASLKTCFLTYWQTSRNWPRFEWSPTLNLKNISSQKGWDFTRVSAVFELCFVFWLAQVCCHCCVCSSIKCALRAIAQQNFKACDWSLMQPSMANLNSPTSRVVKDSTPFRRRILRCKNFGKGESWLSVFLDVVNLYLMKFWHRWILNERTFYSFILLFIWKWILT